MNFKNIVVYDWETDSPKPETCNPVQLGAVVINPRKLEFIKGAEFNSDMRPLDIDDDDYFDRNKSTIEWHSRISKCSTDEVIARWKAAPSQESVWRSFTQWLSKYHLKQSRQSKFTAPIRAGYNILKFDDVITQRMAEKYGDVEKDGTIKIWSPRDHIDLLPMMFWWFENQENPQKYTMDVMRPYFGVSAEKAHDALKDVYDEGQILIKCLQTQRWLTDKLLTQGKLGPKSGKVQV